MSLLERKRENDRKAAEEEARLAEEKKLQDLAVHPLVKDGAGRDIRDAYFSAIAFAAFADDDKLDKDEQVILANIGESLGIAASEIEETLQSIQNLSDDDKFVFIEESVRAISGNELGVKLFYAQFVQIWASHEYSRNELSEYLKRFSEWTGVAAPSDNQLRSILNVLKGGDDIDSDLDSLAKWMGDAALKHFVVKKYGDVSERLVSERNRQRRRFERKKKELLKKAERVRFAAVIEQMSEAHKNEGSLRVGWDNELKEGLSNFRADDIDWSEECKLRLAALDRIPHCYAKLLCNSQERPRRKIVWKLMCMLYVFGGTVRENEIDDLLRSATQLSTEGYRKRIEVFVSRHFNVMGRD